MALAVALVHQDLQYIFVYNDCFLKKRTGTAVLVDVAMKYLYLCQLLRPPYEIHKMINLPAAVKIFKDKLKN